MKSALLLLTAFATSGHAWYVLFYGSPDCSGDQVATEASGTDPSCVEFTDQTNSVFVGYDLAGSATVFDPHGCGGNTIANLGSNTCHTDGGNSVQIQD